MNRRDLISAIALSPVAIAVPAMAAAATDPADRYFAAFNAFNNSRITEDQYMAALDALDDWEPPTHRGFVKKFYMMWFEEGNPSEERVEMMLHQATRLIGGVA